MRKNKQANKEQANEKKTHSFTGNSNWTQSKFTHRNGYWLLDSDVLCRLTLNLGLFQPANTTERSRIRFKILKIINKLQLCLMQNAIFFFIF